VIATTGSCTANPPSFPSNGMAVMVILTCRLAVLDIVAFDWLDV